MGLASSLRGHDDHDSRLQIQPEARKIVSFAGRVQATFFVVVDKLD